jgi:hypothetical protein
LSSAYPRDGSIRRVRRVRKQGFQVSDAFDKPDAPDNHHEVDGIEILFTKKASGEVRFRIGRGLKFIANWTKEPEISLADFRRDVQLIPNQPVDRYQIPQLKQFIARKSSFHRISPLRCSKIAVINAIAVISRGKLGLDFTDSAAKAAAIWNRVIKIRRIFSARILSMHILTIFCRTISRVF